MVFENTYYNKFKIYDTYDYNTMVFIGLWNHIGSSIMIKDK